MGTEVANEEGVIELRTEEQLGFFTGQVPHCEVNVDRLCAAIVNTIDDFCDFVHLLNFAFCSYKVDHVNQVKSVLCLARLRNVSSCKNLYLIQ